MQLITQVWSTEEGRYVEGELDLCACLPSVVREGLRIRSVPTLEPTLWEEAETA